MSRPVFTGSNGTVANASSVTISATVTGYKPFIMVTIVTRFTNYVTGVTYGGNPFTKLTEIDNGAGNQKLEIWYISTTAGTADVVVTLSGTEYCSVSVQKFRNVDTDNPFSDFDTYSGAAGDIDFVMDSKGLLCSAMVGSSTSTITPGVYQLELTASSSSYWRMKSAYKKTAGSLAKTEYNITENYIAISWSIRGSVDFAEPVVDRAQSDIDDRTAKGFFNLSDWDRIYDNCKIARDTVQAALGVSIAFSEIGYPGAQDMPGKTMINALVGNINAVSAALGYQYGITRLRTWADGNLGSLTFSDINKWEQTLETILTLYSHRKARVGVASTGSGLTRQNKFRG
jgi:hypothetical protein